MNILDKLIKIRKEKKIKQVDMLDALGVNPTTLSRYESGKRDMPVSVLEKYIEFLGLGVQFYWDVK